MAIFNRIVRRLRKQYRQMTQPRRGADVCVDLTLLLQPATIFDVGANIGQSAKRFRRSFPRATIHCFEPSEVSAERIRRRRLGKVEVHALALGSVQGTAALAPGHDPATLHIAGAGEETGEAIRIETLDAFCKGRGLDRIDFVKIDTEGHDLEVLKGAAAMLAGGRIGAVQVEAGMNPENTFHVPLEELKRFLEGFGYRLYGFYDQVGEWPTKQPHLRRANPLFVAPHVYGGMPYVPGRAVTPARPEAALAVFGAE